jgi:hypothetical protein
MAQSREVMSRWIIAALCLASAQSAPPTIGPWPTNFTTYEVAVLDRTNPRVWLIYPICDLSECPKFPLISYMHGLAGGDIALTTGYIRHLRELSSYGFVVAAPYSCVFGCNDTSHGAPWTDCAGILPVKPVGWPAYYGEGLKAIDWARNMSRGGSSDKVFTTIDWDAGVGISGHSMGGQAATIAASAACAKRWDIRAAVLEHPTPRTATSEAAAILARTSPCPSLPSPALPTRFGPKPKRSCRHSTAPSLSYPKPTATWSVHRISVRAHRVFACH